MNITNASNRVQVLQKNLLIAWDCQAHQRLPEKMLQQLFDTIAKELEHNLIILSALRNNDADSSALRDHKCLRALVNPLL